MGYLKYMRNLWKRPKENLEGIWQNRLILWRKEPVTVRLERPTRIDRARSLGYRAKPGFIIIRQRVIRGGHKKGVGGLGRRPKNTTSRVVLDKGYQQIAEERVHKKYPNCEVLNSYLVAKDGQHYWFEVILVAQAHPQIIADKRINWICTEKGRAERGLTSAGKKSRGLRSNKGLGAEKLRPSRSAAYRRKASKPRK